FSCAAFMPSVVYCPWPHDARLAPSTHSPRTLAARANDIRFVILSMLLGSLGKTRFGHRRHSRPTAARAESGVRPVKARAAGDHLRSSTVATGLFAGALAGYMFCRVAEMPFWFSRRSSGSGASGDSGCPARAVAVDRANGLPSLSHPAAHSWPVSGL